jgi:hypothetical protein
MPATSMLAMSRRLHDTAPVSAIRRQPPSLTAAGRRVATASVAALSLLAGCSTPPGPTSEEPVPSRASPGGEAESAWRPFVLPGKRATQYRFTTKDGRWAIEARADASASMLRRAVDVPPAALADVSWAWWVDQTLADADLAHVERTDAPAQLVLAFDGDRSRLSARERSMAELARALTGEEPPYATLVYAWATHTPVEAVVHNPRTARVRKIVVDSGSADTRRWREHRRNIVADYVRAFGEPPGRLIGVAVMTDADNTRATARAWYGRITLHAPPAPAAEVPPGR